MKKLIALLLCLAMVFALAACGGKTTTSTTSGGSNSGGSDEIITVKIPFTMTQEPTETEEITKRANEMLAPLGVAVEFTYIPFGDLQTQVGLMLTGGDEVDLFTNRFMGGMTISNMAAKGQIIPLNDLLETYGKDILSTSVKDFLSCTSIGSDIYGVPAMGAFASANLYLVKKDVADNILNALGWTADDVKTFDDLTTFMKKGKELDANAYFLPGSGAAGAWFIGTSDMDVDHLNVANGLVALTDPTKDTTVVNFFATDNFKNALKYAADWKQAGLFVPDAMNAQEALKAQLQKGQIVGTTSGNYSAEADAASYSSSFGFECIDFTLSEPLAVTSLASGGAWCISSTCKHPEAAMKVLNALYSMPEFATMIMNGIEGSDYVVTDRGTFTYPEGKGIASVGWTTGAAWYWPNQTLGKPWEPNDPDTFQGMLEVNDKCLKSLALGFTPDVTAVTDQITACSNVVDTYVCALLYSEVDDVDGTYATFMKELEAAGIQQIVDAVQTQLNDWLAASK